MEDQIIIIATLELINDNLSELTTVVKDLQEHCRQTEKGMLQYDWYKAEDSNTIKVLETYTNSEAVLFHFDNYKPFAPRLNGSRKFVSLEVFGNASDALRKRVEKINAVNYSSISALNK
jgi:quinol monooxygenase YgiN